MQREVGEARLNSLSIGLVSKHDIILLLLIKTSWDWCYSLENHYKRVYDNIPRQSKVRPGFLTI